MSRHSVVDAKNNLSELIARAERGEEVVITRHGHPVVEIKAVSQPRREGGPDRAMARAAQVLGVPLAP